MVLRFLFRFLANNEHLIERLSNSYPIRRAAQLAVYIFTRGKAIGEEGLHKAIKSETGQKVGENVASSGQRLKSFQSSLFEEMKKGYREMQEELKRKGTK